MQSLNMSSRTQKPSKHLSLSAVLGNEDSTLSIDVKVRPRSIARPIFSHARNLETYFPNQAIVKVHIHSVLLFLILNTSSSIVV